MKKFMLLVIITLFFIGSFASSFSVYNKLEFHQSSRGITLYAGGNGPGNYTNIQDAINDSNNGETIFVYNGVYPHNVWIYKSINLVGEGKNNTIIEGGWRTVVIIDKYDVIVTGFTVRNCGSYYIGGIHICDGSNNVTIIDNILSNNLQCGISINGNFNNIENNIIIGNPHGIKLSGNYNKIKYFRI